MNLINESKRKQSSTVSFQGQRTTHKCHSLSLPLIKQIDFTGREVTNNQLILNF